jgi:hypothetical protein
MRVVHQLLPLSLKRFRLLFLVVLEEGSLTAEFVTDLLLSLETLNRELADGAIGGYMFCPLGLAVHRPALPLRPSNKSTPNPAEKITTASPNVSYPR